MPILTAKVEAIRSFGFSKLIDSFFSNDLDDLPTDRLYPKSRLCMFYKSFTPNSNTLRPSRLPPPALYRQRLTVWSAE